jgi:hypothetical protein
MRLWIRNTAFFLAILRICELRTGTPSKFADLRINHYQFADLRLRNEPKNLRICDLQTKNLRSHL